MKIQDYEEEIENFSRMAELLKASREEMPEMKGIDIHGEVNPYKGNLGGDHIVYVDFKKRYNLDKMIETTTDDKIKLELENLKRKAGILLADAAGHNITDFFHVAQLHQVFLTGSLYELQFFGNITTKLFEHINTRFFKSSQITKFITMIYGEISENGEFKFISAGHEKPLIFSNEYNKIISIHDEQITQYPPLGLMPSLMDMDITRTKGKIGEKNNYEVSELKLMGLGDIMLLYTDGLSDQYSTKDIKFKERIESIIKESKSYSAKQIYCSIKEDFKRTGPQIDDISYVIIKKE